MRLIDADALWDKTQNEAWCSNEDRDMVENWLVDAPTAYDPQKVIDEVHGMKFRLASQHAMVISAINRGYKIERRHGKWLPQNYGYRCSVCNRYEGDYDNYCPNCGSKMDGGNDDI